MTLSDELRGLLVEREQQIKSRMHLGSIENKILDWALYRAKDHIDALEKRISELEAENVKLQKIIAADRDTIRRTREAQWHDIQTFENYLFLRMETI